MRCISLGLASDHLSLRIHQTAKSEKTRHGNQRLVVDGIVA